MTSSSARPRVPAVVYATLVVIFMVLLASMALTRRQPPPPTIAEFAPQAVEQILDAPEDRATGSGGEVDGSEKRSDVVEDAFAVAPVTVPRVRHCVGDPPRQIEDPQSPPCVPYWQGDNGGATSRGVTADEIRVASPLSNNAALAGLGGHRFIEAMAKFFNSRFEFYGRSLRMIALNQAGATGETGSGAAAAEAYASSVFASTSTTGDAVNYYYELARRGILGGMYQSIGNVDAAMRGQRPYLWSYMMSEDRQQLNMGEWMCKRLAARPAVHAGDPLMQPDQRVFGLIWSPGHESKNQFTIDPLVAELARCGQAFAAKVLLDSDTTSYDTVTPNAVLQMKTAGVTSVVCLCDFLAFGSTLRSAQNQAYLPEWLISTDGIGAGALVNTAATGPAIRAQLAHTFGLTFTPREVLPSDMPVVWAAKETDPGLNFDQSGFNLFLAQAVYYGMLVLASGVQMAGPNLTPVSFERGMHRTRFPNPVHRNIAGSVGFEDQDYTMTNDGAELWWSNTAQGPSPEGANGAFCYVDGGARRLKGSWPIDPGPFFAGTCDSGSTPR